MNQVLCLHLLLLGLPAALPLPQFLLRPNSIFSPAAPFPPLIFPSSTSPLLYQAASPVSPRARCSSCDCSSDFGCSYNCDKCPALCKTCSCVTSLGCHYNCDKCQATDNQEVEPPVIVAVGDLNDGDGEGSPVLAPVGGAPSSGGGEDGAGLLFPLPGGGNLEDAEDLEDSVDPEDNAEDISEAGDLGPSDPNIIQGGSSCQVLVSDFELCKWGPSCATILREQFSHCDYDCATCTLHGSSGQGVNEEVEVVEVDQVGQVGQQAGGAPPAISAVIADPDDENFVIQVDGNTVWQLLASAQNTDEDFIRPPPFSPVLAEEGDGDNAGPWTWTTDGPGCIAVGGEAKGSQCRFPFTYEGVVYQGCAYKPGGSSAPVPPGSLGWCSTKRDINGIHVNGPSGSPWKYVGFCDNSCPSA